MTAPIVAPPAWLIELLRADVRPIAPKPTRPTGFGGDSIADWFTDTHTWAEVLHGWKCKSADGDADGARWQHPTATSPVSATVKHGLLFVYSNNTAFEQTTAKNPHGYTRFKAWAVIEHGGDMSTAARAARQMQSAAG